MVEVIDLVSSSDDDAEGPHEFVDGVVAAATVFGAGGEETGQRGLLPLVRAAAAASRAAGATLVTASDACELHTVRGDAGFGCGFRNAAMLLRHAASTTSAPPQFTAATYGLTSVEALQATLEAAWSSGFDPSGFSEVGYVVGTRKHIGATEVASVLRFVGFRARVIDFQGASVASDLAERVQRHFGAGERGRQSCSNKAPMMLQYQGHSVLVVGYERRPGTSRGDPDDVFLLLFDPSVDPHELRHALEVQSGWERLMKRHAHRFAAHKDAVQLVYVEAGLATDSEREALKLISADEHYDSR